MRTAYSFTNPNLSPPMESQFHVVLIGIDQSERTLCLVHLVLTPMLMVRLHWPFSPQMSVSLSSNTFRTSTTSDYFSSMNLDLYYQL